MTITVITIITIRIRINHRNNKKQIKDQCQSIVSMTILYVWKKWEQETEDYFFCDQQIFWCDFISTSVGFVKKKKKNVDFFKQFCSIYFEYYDKKRKRTVFFLNKYFS